LFKAILWKLHPNGNEKDKRDYMRQDMWITAANSLCYFSHTEEKRLVLIDGKGMSQAEIKKFEGPTCEDFKGLCFTVKFRKESEVEEFEQMLFACEDKAGLDAWTSHLKNAVNMEAMPRFQLGANMAKDLIEFRLTVKNRRLKAEDLQKGETDADAFVASASIFKGKLAKVKADGDRMKASDWFEREMWISKNGSLVYWSVKEERNLVYYTKADLAKASLYVIPNGQSNKDWTFQVKLHASEDGIEFAPGEFAAESSDMRQAWMDEFAKLKVN
jgi:hypothetical protein